MNLKSLESLLLAIKSEYEALAIVLVPSSPIDTCINPIQPCKNNSDDDYLKNNLISAYIDGLNISRIRCCCIICTRTANASSSGICMSKRPTMKPEPGCD